MKYTFTLETDSPNSLNSSPSSAASSPTREKIILESRAKESPRHIVLKILAYLLFRDEARPLSLEIEQAVGQRHKPDLVAREPDEGPIAGPICLWIDCGQIEPKRLGRIVSGNKQARVIVIKSTESEARLYVRASSSSVPEASARARTEIAGFTEGVVEAAIAALRGVNTLRLSAARSEVVPATASSSGSTASGGGHPPVAGGRLNWNGTEIEVGISLFPLA